MDGDFWRRRPDVGMLCRPLRRAAGGVLCPAHSEQPLPRGRGPALSELRVLHILKPLLTMSGQREGKKNSMRLEQLPGSAVSKWAAAVFAITKAGAFFFSPKYVVGNKE